MSTHEAPYHVEVDHEDYADDYSILVGPDGWACMLGEPEDCTWQRDGSKAVQKLNEQHDEIIRLRNDISELQELIDAS